MVYIGGEKPSDEAGESCPFCSAPDRSDAEGLIVHRGELCYVVLNLFPYNPGHVLVCPYRHVSLYVDLSDEETAEFTALTKQAIHALDKASAPMGYNLGMNQGGGRRGRGGRPPAPARRPALGRRLQLPAHRGTDQGAPDAPRRRPHTACGGLAGGLTAFGRIGWTAPCSTDFCVRPGRRS